MDDSQIAILVDLCDDLPSVEYKERDKRNSVNSVDLAKEENNPVKENSCLSLSPKESEENGSSNSPVVLSDSPMEDDLLKELTEISKKVKKRKLPSFITGKPSTKFSRNNPYSDHLRKKRKLDQAKKNEMCESNMNASGIKTLPSSKKRTIVLDTETTGFGTSDCIIEIGAVEMIDGDITGVQFHSYVNAQRLSHREALKVHGLDAKFLSKQPPINKVLKSFLRFIGEESILIAHNAAFDLRMINQELERLELPKLPLGRVFDTQGYYRQRFPSRSYNLNDACKYYRIDVSHRTIHGALLDAQLTAKLVQKLWALESHEIRARSTNRFFQKRLG